MRVGMASGFVAVGMGWSALAGAQIHRGVKIADQIAACHKIADRDARLTCYDGASDALTSARDRKEIAIVDREDDQKTRQAVFGFSLPKIDLFGSHDKDDALKQIQSRVSSTRDLGYGKWAWSLADGSVWQNVEPEQVAAAVKSGDEITIEAGILGSYKAKVHKSAFKVKRLR